jgi:ribosomal-protein-alanine N-acetyltransferase
MIDLRAFQQGDEALLVSYLNNKALTKYISSILPQPYTKETANWWVETGCKIGYVKAITCNGELVGSIGAIAGEFERQKSAEVGYWIAEPYWGRGIASQALEGFCQFLISNTELVRLYAPVFEGNQASTRVLERCGFTLEATLEKAIYKDNQFYNELLYARIYT